MKIKGRYNSYPVTVMETPSRERHYRKSWYARTGNLITTSEVSREQCINLHLAKLDKTHEQINREEHEIERNCFCY